MNKYLSSILAAALLLGLTACSSSSIPVQGTDPTEQPIVTEAPTASPADPTEEPTEAPADPTEAPTPEPSAEPDPLAAYDEHDYAVLRAFFELADESGITNGEKCFANYDPDDPSTWFRQGKTYDNAVYWSESGKARSIHLEGMDEEPMTLVGSLALNELNSLTAFTAWNAIIETVGADNMPTASDLTLFNLRFPYVNGEASFIGAYLERIRMRSAASTHVELTGESASATFLLPSFKIDISVEGEGYAGVNAWGDEDYYEVHLEAEPLKGYEFLGWFDADGKLVSTDENYTLFGEDSGLNAEGAHAEFVYTARFK